MGCAPHGNLKNPCFRCQETSRCQDVLHYHKTNTKFRCLLHRKLDAHETNGPIKDHVFSLTSWWNSNSIAKDFSYCFAFYKYNFLLQVASISPMFTTIRVRFRMNYELPTSINTLLFFVKIKKYGP